MAEKSRDYSVLDKFNFARKPVRVKFMVKRPKDIKRLDKELNMCEMLKEAQENLAEIPYSPTPVPAPGGVAHRKRVNKMMADLRKKINE